MGNGGRLVEIAVPVFSRAAVCSAARDALAQMNVFP